jgi:hypothetical protein
MHHQVVVQAQTAGPADSVAHSGARIGVASHDAVLVCVDDGYIRSALVCDSSLYVLQGSEHGPGLPGLGSPGLLKDIEAPTDSLGEEAAFIGFSDHRIGIAPHARSEEAIALARAVSNDRIRTKTKDLTRQVVMQTTHRGATPEALKLRGVLTVPRRIERCSQLRVLIKDCSELGQDAKEPASLTRVGRSRASKHERNLTDHGREPHVHAWPGRKTISDGTNGSLPARFKLIGSRRKQHSPARTFAILYAIAQGGQQTVSTRCSKQVQARAHDNGSRRLDTDRERTKGKV